MNRHHHKRQKIWRAIRIFRRFTYADIMRVTKLSRNYCAAYIQALRRAKVIRDDGLTQNNKKVFRIVEDTPKPPTPRYYVKATEEQAAEKERQQQGMDKDIKALFSSRVKRGDVKRLAEKYGVSTHTIHYRARRLGLKVQRHEWSKKELKLLKDNMEMTSAFIAEILAENGYKRTPGAIRSMICVLRDKEEA